MTKIVDFALSKARTTLALACLQLLLQEHMLDLHRWVAADPNIQLPLVSVKFF